MQTLSKTPQVKKETSDFLTLNFCNTAKIFQNLFAEASGLGNQDLVGKMFKINAKSEKTNSCFSVLWKNIQKNNFALLKKLTNSNIFYWYKVEFKIESNNTILFIIADRITSQLAIDKINKFHKTLLSIEKNRNTSIALKFFEGFLEEKNQASYKSYINSIT
jgi:hypothetical protein